MKQRLNKYKMDNYKIRLVNQEDYCTWIELAKEVECLFGSMVDSKEFCKGIKDCIHKNNAFGIENKNKDLMGIIALDRENNEIIWLAVAKKYRGNRYGDKLVKKAIDELKINGDIYVQTFSKREEQGKSARIVYENNGFVDFKNADNNPANMETVVMIKTNKI